MAKVMIIFEDGQEEGAVKISWKCDPPFEVGPDITPAQEAALQVVAAAKTIFAPVTRKQVAPGIYEDAGGALHFHVPQLLEVFGIEDTPKNRDICVEQARRVVAEKWPNTPVEVRD